MVSSKEAILSLYEWMILLSLIFNSGLWSNSSVQASGFDSYNWRILLSLILLNGLHCRCFVQASGFFYTYKRITFVSVILGLRSNGFVRRSDFESYEQMIFLIRIFLWTDYTV